MNAMASDPNNPFGQAEAEMHQAMMAATGADPSETWIRKMIEHHRGAVAMSDVVLAQNPTPEVRAQATKTREAQLREIELLEAMLVPEPAAQAGTGAGSAPSTPASSEPAATPRSRAGVSSPPNPAPKRTPPPPPPAAADPHAGHDMNTMNNMNRM
ncbi:MAG: DUF305 domain-containing protein [Sphingomonas sp.]|nr:DUF305 domain-containing protein [Sphingomonas sp.]